MVLLAVSALGCGAATEVPTIVVSAEVTSSCTVDGGCARQTVTVGHCGPGVRVPDQRGQPVHVETDRPPSELSGVVAVRHDSGDRPTGFGNGGSTRGWLLFNGEQARVDAFHQPGVTLYSIGESGEPGGFNQQLLAGDAGLVFRYTTATGVVVTETHRVVELSPRPIEVSSPGDIMNACCSMLPGRSLWALLAVAALFRSQRVPPTR